MTSAPHGLTRRSLIVGSAGTGAFAMLGMHGKHPARASSTATTPAGNWVHLATISPQVLDDQLLEHFVENFNGVSFRSLLHGPEPRYDYASIVTRIKALNAQVPILMYVDAALWVKQEDVGRIEQYVLAGYDDLGELLMPEWEQGVRRRYWGDPRNPEFRQWVTQRYSTWVEDMGVDGVFIDLCRKWPRLALDDEQTTAYGRGMEQLLADTVEVLGRDRITMFNGLWSDEAGNFPEVPNPLEIQLTLLPHASGAMIEYFGIDPLRQNPAPVVPYLPIPTQFADKTLMFSGRGSWQYESYQDDYRRQRYDYAAYLLAAGDHAYFKYSAQFQQPTLVGRTGADAVFADWQIDFGRPVASYEQRGTLYVREFDNGVVVLNPEPVPGETGEAQSLELRRPMFDPEGNRYRRFVTVEPGIGLLLLYRPVHRGGSRVIEFDFGDGDSAGGDWRWASRHRTYLHLDATPPEEEWEHDLLLDPVRSLDDLTTFYALLRTEDSTAKLDLVAEVDDTAGIRNRVIIQATTEAAPPGTAPTLVPGNPFRSPPAGPQRHSFPAHVAIEPDGDWHSIRVDVPTILEAAGGQYTAHRLAHVRILGTMDIRKVRICRTRTT